MSTITQPQKEYIITEKQLKKYEGLFFLDDDAQGDFKTIRSRPAPSLPPETCVFGYSPELCHEKDTAIRNATLDEVISAIAHEHELNRILAIQVVESLRTQEHR